MILPTMILSYGCQVLVLVALLLANALVLIMWERRPLSAYAGLASVDGAIYRLEGEIGVGGDGGALGKMIDVGFRRETHQSGGSADDQQAAAMARAERVDYESWVEIVERGRLSRNISDADQGKARSNLGVILGGPGSSGDGRIDVVGTVEKGGNDHAAEEEAEESSEVVSALLVFGDSTVDAGTNKHLLTVSRSDFPPYGRDLASKQPTGRFCNGLLVTDYLASMMGLNTHTKAYLDTLHYKENHNLKHPEKSIDMEVSFASASSGIHDSTAKHFNALSLSKQLEHFKEYRDKLILAFGKKRCMEIMTKAIFIISTGTNDFLNNYLLNPYLRAKYSHDEFQDMLITLCGNFIEWVCGQVEQASYHIQQKASREDQFIAKKI